MKHVIKTESVYFQQIIDGKKRFEVRINDRGYNAGDQFVMIEVEDGVRGFGEIHGSIDYVTNYNQKDGWVVWGFTVDEIRG